mmetsp:Transcript_31365/g.66309  ORF Transcript_31365/g.66309 Transcript_31365/m.66309 type:complete len:207 (+) Transcript_31365:1429-2049(+)
MPPHDGVTRRHPRQTQQGDGIGSEPRRRGAVHEAAGQRGQDALVEEGEVGSMILVGGEVSDGEGGEVVVRAGGIGGVVVVVVVVIGRREDGRVLVGGAVAGSGDGREGRARCDGRVGAGGCGGGGGRFGCFVGGRVVRIEIVFGRGGGGVHGGREGVGGGAIGREGRSGRGLFFHGLCVVDFLGYGGGYRGVVAAGEGRAHGGLVL